MSHEVLSPALGPGLWLDTDLALGAPSGDVDDAFALLAVVRAARAGGRPVLGVSAVTGNTDGVTAEACITALFAAMGQPLAGSPAVDAPTAVAEAAAPTILSRLPEGSSIVALGPPTNLVKAARLDPRLPPRIEVRVVGGVLRRWQHPLLSWLDLNFRKDRAASREFWRLPWRSRRVFPLDVVRHLRFDAADLDRLEAAGGASAYLGRGSRRWLARARFVHLSRSFPAWDLPAALDAVGALPGAQWSTRGAKGELRFLHSLDVEAAREVFFTLVGA